MRNKKTQYEWVESILIREGEISRNFCLQNFVSRLGAIICDLKKDGWNITGDYEKKNGGKDFVYRLDGSIQPKKLESIYVGGVKVAERVIKL